MKVMVIFEIFFRPFSRSITILILMQENIKIWMGGGELRILEGGQIVEEQR
jgi:hypothetical protein